MVIMLNYFRSYVLYPLAERQLKRDILGKVKLLRLYDNQPFAQRKQQQLARLVLLLKHAGAKVPYYRKLFKKAGFDPQLLFKDIRYFNDLPYLTKDILAQQSWNMLDKDLNPRALHQRKTGGSTGVSTIIYYDQNSLDWTAASNLRVLEWMGKKRHHTEVHLSTYFPEPEDPQAKRMEWIKCQCLNRINVLTDSFEPEALDRTWKRLKQVGPHHIEGHPSTLYALARHVLATGLQCPNVIKTFESTGELLDHKKRVTIEKAFDCTVYDRFGNAEFGVVSHELPETRCNGGKIVDYMVYPEVSLYESEKEIVLTGLSNYAMPLIRYRTGDMGQLEERTDGYYLNNIQGRIHDLVPIGGKLHPTHYVQDILDRLGGVQEFQIVTQDTGKPELRLVVPQEERREHLQEKIKDFWGDSFSVRFVEMNELISQGWRNKFRYVVNR